MREKFQTINLRAAALDTVQHCNRIIAGYQQQGLKLTLRQLYYQLVHRNIIKNNQREYKRLSSVISDARLSGLIDWNAIEDRIRRPIAANEYRDLKQLVDAALYSYRLPRWSTQDNYVELWVEKDALAGVLEPLAREYHVTLMVNRGYSSQSAMYESAARFKAKQDESLNLSLIYLGDFDPSGEDMVRDISERLEMFGVDDLTVTKVALTRDQIDEFEPPPNPAKISDPRAQKFIAEHGSSSWEVDALPPEELQRIIREAFDEIVDQDAMQVIIDKETSDKAALSKAVKKIK